MSPVAEVEGSMREMARITHNADQVKPAVDLMQAVLGRLPQVEMPLTHRFTPGLYIREILMPKGTLVISRTHKFEHPFVVSKGRVSVWDQDWGVKHITAPYCGITKPGTRRVLLIHEDCVWTTFHVTTETDPEKIVEQVTEPVPPMALDEEAVRYMLRQVDDAQTPTEIAPQHSQQ